jgi:hypothetical protein
MRVSDAQIEDLNARADLGALADPRKPELSRGRLYVFVASLNWRWRAAFALAAAFWLTCALVSLFGRPL